MRGPGSAFVIDDATGLRNAVNDKAGAYGNLAMPYVVAVQHDAFSPDDFDVANALFGHEQVTARVGPGPGPEAVMSCAPDGAWFGPFGVQNRRVSAVLVVKGLRPWTVLNVEPALWLHPEAEYPFPLEEVPWRTVRVSGNGSLLHGAPVVPLPQFFELPVEWPGPEEPWSA